MATKEELEQELERTRVELEQARAELANLRTAAMTGFGDKPRVAPPPKFGMSEGVRQEIELTGQATDPYTGKKLTREDLPE